MFQTGRSGSFPPISDIRKVRLRRYASGQVRPEDGAPCVTELPSASCALGKVDIHTARKTAWRISDLGSRHSASRRHVALTLNDAAQRLASLDPWIDGDAREFFNKNNPRFLKSLRQSNSNSWNLAYIPLVSTKSLSRV